MLLEEVTQETTETTNQIIALITSRNEEEVIPVALRKTHMVATTMEDGMEEVAEVDTLCVEMADHLSRQTMETMVTVMMRARKDLILLAIGTLLVVEYLK
jgi:hypothetical protein